MGLLQKEFPKLLTRSGFVLICRVSGAVIAFATQIMMARWMGATELGIYVYAFALSMLLSTIAALGLPAASLRFISQYLVDNKTTFINGFISKGRKMILISSLCVGSAALFILVAVSVSISVTEIKTIDDNVSLTLLFASTESVKKYHAPVVISIICIPVIALFRFHDRIAHAFSWFVLSFLPSMTLRPLCFLIALYVIWALTGSLSAEIAMIIQLCVIVVIASAQFVLLRSKIKKRIKDDSAEYEQSLWLRTAIPLLIITVFTQYFPELSIIIIGTDLPLDKIAIYNASYRTALLIGFVYNSVSAAIVPKVSQLYAKGDVLGMQRYITRATQLNFFLSMLGIGIFAFSGEFLLAFFGKEFIAGYSALLILSLAQLFVAGVGPVAILLNITGHQDKCLYAFSASIVLALLLEWYLVPEFGLIGAAMMVLFVMIFWSLWLHFLVKRYLDIHASIFSFLVVRN